MIIFCAIEVFQSVRLVFTEYTWLTEKNEPKKKN